MEVFKTLWPLNGDHISRIYSGTGAMEAGTKGTVSNVFYESDFKKISRSLNDFIFILLSSNMHEIDL